MPLLGFLAGCSLPEVDYTTKTCSVSSDCPPAWSCDPVRGRCADTRGEDPGCAPAFTPSDLRVAWTTPNTIRWQWQPPSDGSRFGRYELWIGLGDPAGMDATGADTIWTSQQNAELGKYILPHTGGGDDLVRGTVTDGLTEETLYWGHLRAYDDAGCPSISAAVTATTGDRPLPGAPPGGREIVLFEGAAELATAVLDPPELQLLSEPGVGYGDDEACLAFDQPVLPFTNLQVTELDVDLSVIGHDVATTAYWEVAVAVPSTSYWSQLYLVLGADPSAQPLDFVRFEPYTFSAGPGYRLLQVPLHAMTSDLSGAPPTKDDLSQHLSAFVVGGSFESGQQVRIDHVSIRW